jgi:outer membrane lipoprotein-sorting protein
VGPPDRILWVYREPEKRYFLLEGATMTAWYPDRRIAERQDVQRYGQRLRRMMGLGESSEDLVRSNQVNLLARSELDSAAELLLVPRNRRIREYVAEVRLWIDEESALVRQVRYQEPSGDQVTIRIDSPELNPELPSSELDIPIPDDVVIREELSSLGPLGEEE